MKHTASKIFRALCGMAVMLALAASITPIPVFAASNGIYIATATPHYKHPVTGKVEDSGGESSSVLGQSMTESATYRKALVEVDADGSTYVTVRLKLMDNIQNPEFRVDGSPVSATPMQEDLNKHTADYRMKVKSESSVIRCTMYVVPMGRQVIFYITVSDLQSGSEDFLTSIRVDPANTPSADTSPADTSPSDTKQPAAPGKTAPSDTAKETPETPADNTAEPEAPAAEEKSDEPAGLQEFDASGNRVDNEKSDKAAHDTGESRALVWVLGGIAVVLAGGAVWYFCFLRKRK